MSLARFLTARRTAWVLIVVPLLLAGALLSLGEADRSRQVTDSLPVGFDSTLAAELRDALPEDAPVAVVLWTADEGVLDDRQRAAIGETAAGVLADLAGEGAGPGEGSGPPEDAGPGGPAGGDGPVTRSEDGTAAIAVVPVEAANATDTAGAVTDLRERLTAEAPAGVTAAVTGPAGIEADLAGVFDGANTRLLLTTAGVVAFLLILTYRSPVLWLVPLSVVGLADRTAAIAATHVVTAVDGIGGYRVAFDESTVGILSVLVFGAGTNYALLLISRYRDELRRHASVREAMRVAWRRTLEPVLASAVTVVVGVLVLTVAQTPTTRGLGIACAVGITVAAAAVLLVLPAALVSVGRWVFWPKVPREGQTLLADGGSGWRRIGDAVAARPAATVLGTLVVLGALASGLLSVQTGLDQDEQFLDEPQAITAAVRLAESFPAGSSDPLQVLTRAPADEVAAAVTGVEGVSSVRPSASADGISRLDAVLEAPPSSDEAEEAVELVRAAVADFPDTHVGGSEAEALDERAAAGEDRWIVQPLILGSVFLALVLLLRSLVAPVLLALAVVASYGAALGVSWWFFTGVLGFTALDVSTPLFAFLFLVALGVDYSIFLVTRAREEAVEHGTREGMLRALAATGGVITSAGILLAAVFAVLGVLPLVVLAQIGTVICIGVLLDTLVVRTLLVPALAQLLGERFWWPRRVHRPAAGA